MPWQNGNGRDREPKGVNSLARNLSPLPAARTVGASVLASGFSRSERRLRYIIKEPDVQDVAVFDGVLFAFQAQLAGGFGGVPGPGRDQVVERQHFGADEAARQVRVDAARRRQGVRPGGNGPGADLVLADGEERHTPSA